MRNKTKDSLDMAIEEKTQVNPMIQKKTERRIKKEAERRNIHPTTFCGQILDKYAHYLLDKEIRGDLMVGRKVLELMLECKTDKEYEINAKKAATYINTETLGQIGGKNISYKDRRDRIKAWHELNGFKFNETDESQTKRWFIIHHMGEKWSKFQYLVNIELLRKTGCEITGKKDDFDELRYTIEFKTAEIDFQDEQILAHHQKGS